MLEIFKESKGIQSSEQALVPEAPATAVFLGSPDKLPNQPAGSTARPATLPSRLEEKLWGHSSLYLRSAALTVAIIYAEQRIRAQTQTSFSQPLPLHHTVPCLTWAAFPAPYSLLPLPETGEVFLNTLIRRCLWKQLKTRSACPTSPYPLSHWSHWNQRREFLGWWQKSHSLKVGGTMRVWECVLVRIYPPYRNVVLDSNFLPPAKIKIQS